LKTVTLYGKPGCHLCDEVRAILEEVALEFGFALHEINIQNDAVLFERYRLLIPVVAIEGREIGRGEINERALLAALAAR
jgi:glutaredoxin